MLTSIMGCFTPRIAMASGVLIALVAAVWARPSSPVSQSQGDPGDASAFLLDDAELSFTSPAEFNQHSVVQTAGVENELKFGAKQFTASNFGADLPSCPENTLVGQNVDPPSSFTAYVSELSANQKRFENVSGVAGAITGVRWFGLDLRFLGNGQWTDCTESNNTFTISFHQSVAGIPGAAVCTYTVLAKRVPTGVFYGGFEMNEYRATLPDSCIMTNGWISIQGQGDPDCWFLWMSSPDGDLRSYCQGCISSNQTDDLAFCILGTPGGIFGACCIESNGQCLNNVEINQCAVPGTRFVPNTACANLDPPCAIVTGACCFPNNTCSIITSADCTFGGGSWLGGGTTCAQCPVLGACCHGFDSCTFETQQGCMSEGGVWLGGNTTCDHCPEEPICPKDSLFSQDPSDRFDFIAGTSEESANIRRWENFSGVPGPITSLTFWGLDLKPLGGGAWQECAESDPTFIINFHKDANGKPGNLFASYQLLCTRTPLNINYNGVELNRYDVTLPQPCVLVRGWVSIIGLGDPQCWFLWMSSGTGGFSWCDRCNPSPQGFNLAMCLQGPYGGVSGACCTDSTASCVDGVNISNCINNDQRFTPNTTCSQLDPACGVIVGACCYPNATCAITEETPCIAAGGNWIGPNSICQYCPCITPCPDGSVQEGETVCADNYIDTFNGGCIVAKPNFLPLQLGQTVCGRSGVFLINGNVSGDFDWYQVHVPAATTLKWSVRAEFRSRIWIFDANNGCPGTQLAFAAATECFDYSISTSVQPGFYWLIFGPLAFDDAAYCGARYYARATIEVPCPADVAPPGGNDIVNVSDLLLVISNWGPCTGACPGDINADALVNVSDLLAVISAWGPCP